MKEEVCIAREERYSRVNEESRYERGRERERERER
jgi:hypothetical protein